MAALLHKQIVGQFLKNISILYFSTTKGVSEIVFKRDKPNESNNMSLLPVLLSQLVRMLHLEFCNAIATE